MISIREYKEADRRAVIDLVVELQDAEASFEVDRYPGAEVAEKYFSQILTPIIAKGKILVAVNDEQVVAFTSFEIETDDDVISKIKEVLCTTDVVVSKDFRRQGIAAMLLEAVKQYAKERNIRYVKVNTLARNTAMQNALDKNGFRPYEFTYISEL